MRGIAHYVASHYPTYRIRYVSTETFLNEFVEAIRTNALPEFKRRYRDIDVLLIDDIQFMEGKDGLQEEFFHTFNELHQNNKQIVLSSDRTPDAMPTLEDRLRSRFKWGLITDIQRPDLETRLAILSKKAQSKTIDIPDDVLLFIAENITDSIRELEGALIKVTAYANLTQQPLTVDLASLVLGDLITNNQKKPVTARRIIEMTAEMFGFEVEQIIGGSRRRPLVDARQVAMYVTRNMTDLSFPDIGKEFGLVTTPPSCTPVARSRAGWGSVSKSSTGSLSYNSGSMPPPEDHAGDSMSNGGGRPGDDDWFIHRVEVGHRHACGRPGTRWGRKIRVTTTKNLCIHNPQALCTSTIWISINSEKS